jgi:hypothetical protein
MASAQIPSIPILLGCVGLLIGGIGIVSSSQQSADNSVAQSKSWPRPGIAGVEFHDEMVELISMGPQPGRRTEVRQDGLQLKGNPNIRVIRTVRFLGSRQPQYVEIEFVDRGGRSYVRRYPAVDQVSARDVRGNNFEADRSAETYSQRRSRRYRRGHFRRWW